MNTAERDRLEDCLRSNLQLHAEELKQLLAAVSDHWGYEDKIYRFYHQSFKVFRLTQSTAEIVAALQSLLPDQRLNEWFLEITAEGTGRDFTPDDNNRWLQTTRPIVEAFFHTRFFLEMACRYCEPPRKDQPLPSGWAALLYLYNIR